MIIFDSVLNGRVLRVVVDGVIFKPAETVKSLGLLIDKDLRFRSQVRAIVQKSYALLRNLNRHILCKNLKKKLCDTLV